MKSIFLKLVALKALLVVASRRNAMLLIRMFVLLIISAFTLSTGNAQNVFIGGNLGVDINSGDPATLFNSYSGYSISFAPMAGYYINDNTAIGLKVNLSGGKSKNFASQPEIKISYFRWDVSAFSRYNVWKKEKFSLSFEGSTGVGGYSQTDKYGEQTNKLNPSTIFSINVVPLLSYSLTDRLSIEGQFNFLNLGFSSRTEKDVLSSKRKTRNSFSLGVNNSWDPFKWRVGFIFKI